MNKMKHIIVLFCITFLLTAIVYFFPQKEKVISTIPFLNKTSTEVDSTIIPLDTIPYIQKLKESLPLIKAIYSEKRQKHIWTLGKGKTIPVYLLQIQKHIQAHHGKIISMEELFLSNTFQAASLVFTNSIGDTTFIELQISENVFSNNISKIAIAFEINKLSNELITKLNELDFSYSILVTPFNLSNPFFDQINQLKKAETVLWLYMESEKLRSSHHSKNPIRIHHTEEKIEEIIDLASEKFPKAKGIATRYGEKAVEHRNLLNAIFKSLQEKNFWFLDLTENRASLVNEICKNHPLKCKQISPYSDKTSTIEDYISKNLRLALRTGTSYIILPLTLKNITEIEQLLEKAAAQGTEITTLSNVIAVTK